MGERGRERERKGNQIKLSILILQFSLKAQIKKFNYKNVRIRGDVVIVVMVEKSKNTHREKKPNKSFQKRKTDNVCGLFQSK